VDDQKLARPDCKLEFNSKPGPDLPGDFKTIYVNFGNNVVINGTSFGGTLATIRYDRTHYSPQDTFKLTITGVASTEWQSSGNPSSGSWVGNFSSGSSDQYILWCPIQGTFTPFTPVNAADLRNRNCS
jgi:hypothetical protein